MIPANGVRLHVQTAEQKGEPLVLMHFGSAHAAVWNGVIPYLAPDYWVIVPEMRGHGHSDKSDGGYTIDEMARDLAGVLDHLGVERAHIVGSSLGAEVGASFAAQFPQRVITLVCEGAFQNAFGPYGAYEVPDDQIEAKKAELRAARAGRPVPIYDTAEQLVEAMRIMYQSFGKWNAHYEAAIRYDVGPTADGRFARLSPKRVTDQYMEGYWDTRFERYHQRISCPVLFLPSQEEAESERVQQSLTWMRSCLQDSEVALIPGADHALVVLDQPDRFAQAVIAFHASRR